jgi:hypothetical protein
MNTASLELCKELYGLSLWQPVDELPHGAICDARFWVQRAHSLPEVKHQLASSFNSWDIIVPAYDIGYMLSKLPELRDGYEWQLSPATYEDYKFSVGYPHHTEAEKLFGYGDTSEDATCKLIIELFKQGILTRS